MRSDFRRAERNITAAFGVMGCLGIIWSLTCIAAVGTGIYIAVRYAMTQGWL